jgi:small subunit ribosomal protein S7
MPRKGSAPRRDLMPDPVHRSVVVTQLVNKLLQRGKRSLSEKIVYASVWWNRLVELTPPC